MNAIARRKPKSKPVAQPKRANRAGYPIEPVNVPRRAAVLLSEKLFLGIFDLRDVVIVGASFEASTGNIRIVFSGEACPACAEGSPAQVVDLEVLRCN